MQALQELIEQRFKEAETVLAQHSEARRQEEEAVLTELDNVVGKLAILKGAQNEVSSNLEKLAMEEDGGATVAGTNSYCTRLPD